MSVGGLAAHALHDVRTGRFERSLAALTAAGAAVTAAETNLYITDGSVLPTQGSANPALTIMALAARCADRLTAGARLGVDRLEAV
jgi:hypothetical protein